MNWKCRKKRVHSVFPDNFTKKKGSGLYGWQIPPLLANYSIKNKRKQLQPLAFSHDSRDLLSNFSSKTVYQNDVVSAYFSQLHLVNKLIKLENYVSSSFLNIAPFLRGGVLNDELRVVPAQDLIIYPRSIFRHHIFPLNQNRDNGCVISVD